MDVKFLIIHDEWKSEAGKLAQEIEEWFKERGIETEMQPQKVEREHAKVAKTIAIVLGGDSFIMRQSKRLQKSKIPLLGINFGRYGFLAVAEPEEGDDPEVYWENVLEKVLRGEYTVKKHMTLAAQHLDPDGKLLHAFELVNDIYIRHPKRMVVLRVGVNDEIAHQGVFADGAIVATPQGSTAYFRTSGGRPFPSGIGVGFISPMDENVKHFVREEDDIIKIVLLDIGSFKKEPAYLFADGQDVEMNAGEKIVVRKSPKKAYFVEPKGFSWFRIAQRKLGLSK